MADDEAQELKGPDFKSGFNDTLPTANVDVAPTVARILQFSMPAVQGRVLEEALKGGPPISDYGVLSKTYRSSAKSGLTVVGDAFHQSSPQGVTGTVLLAESHLAIHTWPEHGFVTVDVYVCNLATDNTAKAERLFRALQSALKPQRTKFHSIHRGGTDAHERQSA